MIKQNLNNEEKSDSKATLLFGLPDNRAVKVGGIRNDGEIVYSWAGNSDFNNYINLEGLNKSFISIIWHNEPERNVKKPDILVNCINDADICKNSLKVAIDITNSIKQKWPDAKVFNDPAAILRTTRDKIYQQYNHLPGLYIPKVIRIAPASADDVLQAAKNNDLAFPFLIRECGSHGSAGLQIIRDENDRDRLEKYGYDGREFYLTEFVNNKNAEGFYNKARLVIIGGKMFARHFMTSPQWLVYAGVHYHYMSDKEELKKIEENFIANYREILSSEALASLEAINADLGLDYLGFDVAPMPDGRLLVFEINVAQNALLRIDFEKFPYMKQNQANIITALNNCIAEKISATKLEVA